MATIDVDGCRIAYCVDGSEGAPPLLLSNALGSSLAMWEQPCGMLEAGFRLIRYDNPGHGDSGGVDRTLTLDDLARVASAVLDACGASRAHVMGLSLGGMVAMHLGAHAPERVGRLVLCNTSAFMPDKDGWNARIETMRNEGVEPLLGPLMERWFTAKYREADPLVLERTQEMVRRVDPGGYVGCCAAIRDMDLRPDLGRIQAPTLVVAGEQDPVTTVAMAEEIVAGIEGTKLVTLPLAHMTAMEDGTSLARVASEFLRS